MISWLWFDKTVCVIQHSAALHHSSIHSILCSTLSVLSHNNRFHPLNASTRRFTQPVFQKCCCTCCTGVAWILKEYLLPPLLLLLLLLLLTVMLLLLLLLLTVMLSMMFLPVLWSFEYKILLKIKKICFIFVVVTTRCLDSISSDQSSSRSLYYKSLLSFDFPQKTAVLLNSHNVPMFSNSANLFAIRFAISGSVCIVLHTWFVPNNHCVSTTFSTLILFCCELISPSYTYLCSM